MADATIRPATPVDFATIVALTDEAYAPYLLLLGAPPLPVTEDYAPRIARAEVSLLELEGEPAGLIVIERHADHALIFSVAVSPRFQGRRLGTKLLDFAVAETRRWRLPELRLYTNARMEKNIAIYAAYGFRETARRPNPHRPGWVLVDMAMAI